MLDQTTPNRSSTDAQFGAGDTLVECYAGGEAGTGKTTRLIEWFYAQHGTEAARIVIDPPGDDSIQTVAVSRLNPLDIEPHSNGHMSNLPREQSAAIDKEVDAP